MDLFIESKTHTISQITSPGSHTGSDFIFTFVNSHIKDSFKFYPKVIYTLGSTFTNLVDVVVSCGPLSTIITIPSILPDTSPYLAYRMIFPESNY